MAGRLFAAFAIGSMFVLALAAPAYAPPPPPVTTTTQLESSANPSPLGQTVTFTATVSPGTAPGTVFFVEGPGTFCVTSVVAGTASCTISTLEIGNHFIQARYTPTDPSFTGSTSATLTQVVVDACPSTFDFDFDGTEYDDCFRDVHLGGLINAGSDVGPLADHPSLVFTGQTGSGGATWLTVYDTTPSTPAPGPTFGAETLCADVLFARFNNIKGAGVVALLNEGVGKSGLALIVSDAGNTDLLRLATVDGDPTKKGKLKILSSVPLKNGIAENVWYRLVMTVDPTTPRVTGKVFTHSVPLNPDSALGVQVGATLTYELPLPDGVSSPGQNGIMAQAVSAVVDLSVTNFSNDPAVCTPVQCLSSAPGIACQ
jgi:hypothetical protein